MLNSSSAYSGGGTALTYQGRLLNADEPANGLFNLEFSLWDDPAAGSQIGSTIMFNSLAITDGLLTVELDFGANAFDNTDRWLEVTVDGVPLMPRQPITRTPYSIQTRGIFVDQDQRAFVGREEPLTFAEYFGFNADVNSGYGGMYISTNTADGWPFYGYAAGSNGDMWHYYDGTTGKWHVHNGGEDRLTIQSDGNVGIGTTDPFYPIHAVSNRGLTTIFGHNTATSGISTNGVFGRSNSTGGNGVFGWASASSGTTRGVVGQTDSPSGCGVFSFGDYGGTGTKYFIQPHPYDPSKEIRFVCLEGNESGTYFRGSTQLVDGRAVIEVPEEFRLVTEVDGLTVQVTAKGPNAGLWVQAETLDQIIVRGNGNVKFNYFVNGIRRGFADLELTRENHSYVPQVRGVPYGTQYREGHRQVLVDNGILNPDFTPNEETAAMMGWKLRDPDTESSHEQISIFPTGEENENH